MRKIRDPDLLDRLEQFPRHRLSTTVWRITRAGRDPLLASAAKGRWDDGSFNVLYTSCDADTARAELHWHLTRGQPVYPSALTLRLSELQVEAQSAIFFGSLEALIPFGVDPQRYGTLDYAKRQAEYSMTQQIGEAAHFLGADALVVPSARWPGQNLVVLTDNLAPDALRYVADHGAQDLKAWAAAANR